MDIPVTPATAASLLDELGRQTEDGRWRFEAVYREVIEKWASRVCISPSFAESVADKVCEEIRKKYKSFEPGKGKKFRSWLKAVVTNCSRDVNRKWNAERDRLSTLPVSEAVEYDDASIDALEEDLTKTKHAVAAFVEEKVREKIRGEHTWEIYVAYRDGKGNNKEIAQRFEKNPAAVERSYYRTFQMITQECKRLESNQQEVIDGIMSKL